MRPDSSKASPGGAVALAAARLAPLATAAAKSARRSRHVGAADYVGDQTGIEPAVVAHDPRASRWSDTGTIIATQLHHRSERHPGRLGASPRGNRGAPETMIAGPPGCAHSAGCRCVDWMTRSGGGDGVTVQPAVTAGSMPPWTPMCREYRRECREALGSRCAQRDAQTLPAGRQKPAEPGTESRWTLLPQIDVANLCGKVIPLAIVFKVLGGCEATGGPPEEAANGDSARAFSDAYGNAEWTTADYGGVKNPARRLQDVPSVSVALYPIERQATERHQAGDLVDGCGVLETLVSHRADGLPPEPCDQGG